MFDAFRFLIAFSTVLYLKMKKRGFGANLLLFSMSLSIRCVEVYTLFVTFGNVYQCDKIRASSSYFFLYFPIFLSILLFFLFLSNFLLFFLFFSHFAFSECQIFQYSELLLIFFLFVYFQTVYYLKTFSLVRYQCLLPLRYGI